MNLVRFLRKNLKGTPIQKLMQKVENFCAFNLPGVYAYLWKLHNEVKIKDCGKNILIEMPNSQPVLRPKKEFDYSISLPLNFETDFAEKKIAAVIHIFYPELAEEIKKLLQNIPCKVDVYISTVSEEKKSAIEEKFYDFDKGKVVVKIFENRGRDIAPAFVGFKDIYKNYNLCVHLHSKKSPHAASRLFGWRDYLYHNLLGSEKIVRGIFQIMENPKVGIIFPQYFTQIRISINWGENFFAVKNFLSQLGIELEETPILEFPAGSMFWFKPAALSPLFESNVTFANFPEELGQTDGTIAHAIERSFLFIAKSAGFYWIKTCSIEKDNGATPVLKSDSQIELEKNILICTQSQ